LHATACDKGFDVAFIVSDGATDFAKCQVVSLRTSPNAKRTGLNTQALGGLGFCEQPMRPYRRCHTVTSKNIPSLKVTLRHDCAWGNSKTRVNAN
jgi:hypothetical protein